MGILNLTYCYPIITEGVLLLGKIAADLSVSSAASPYRFILYSAFVISFVYLFVMSQTRRLIKTKKLLKEKEEALELIAHQKMELELRDKHITDSLIYAQRIQEALLPSENYFRKYFPDSFILFKTKGYCKRRFLLVW